jgi:hypothetical protein
MSQLLAIIMMTGSPARNRQAGWSGRNVNPLSADVPVWGQGHGFRRSIARLAA